MSDINWILEKVVSGGQSGVDRAALDVAMRVGIPVGGWCPAGRWAEDGRIDSRYPLKETESSDPAQRTILNVRDSDGTLVLGRGAGSAGTNLTLLEAEKQQRPVFRCSPLDLERVIEAVKWAVAEDIRVLNVAGPRDSEVSGIYGFAARFLLDFFELCGGAKTDQPRNSAF